MRYFRVSKDHSFSEEITYDDALWVLLGTYGDNDTTRDMLTIPNRIPCKYSVIDVISDDGMCLMAGLQMMLPDGIEYGSDGNRTENSPKKAEYEFILQRAAAGDIPIVPIDTYPDYDHVHYYELREMNYDLSQGTGNVISRYLYIPALDILCNYVDY